MFYIFDISRVCMRCVDLFGFKFDILQQYQSLCMLTFRVVETAYEDVWKFNYSQQNWFFFITIRFDAEKKRTRNFHIIDFIAGAP